MLYMVLQGQTPIVNVLVVFCRERTGLSVWPQECFLYWSVCAAVWCCVEDSSVCVWLSSVLTCCLIGGNRKWWLTLARRAVHGQVILEGDFTQSNAAVQFQQKQKASVEHCTVSLSLIWQAVRPQVLIWLWLILPDKQCLQLCRVHL